MLQVGGLLEQLCHLLAREDLRQPLRHLGPRQIELCIPTLERHAVEKLQGAAGNIDRTVRELALFEQVQQITLYFLFTEAVRALAMKLRKPRHPLHVGLARAQGQSAHHHVRFHLLAQWAHDDLLCQSREHSQVEPDTGSHPLAPPQPPARSCDQPLPTVEEKCRPSHHTHHRVSGLVQRTKLTGATTDGAQRRRGASGLSERLGVTE